MAQLEELKLMLQSAKDELKNYKKSAEDMQSALEATIKDKKQINANLLEKLHDQENKQKKLEKEREKLRRQ